MAPWVPSLRFPASHQRLQFTPKSTCHVSHSKSDKSTQLFCVEVREYIGAGSQPQESYVKESSRPTWACVSQALDMTLVWKSG